MDSAVIQQSARATLEGTKPFPAIVADLISAGVEYYHVDYIGRCFSYYGFAGDRVVAPIDYEGLPAVAADFEASALKAAIHDSQRNGQKYRDFSRRAMSAGVQGYMAFLRGKRVVYIGRQGDLHTEWFPGAQPTKP